MFKPLLKTLPSLSGNMQIACKLEGYKYLKDNIYECFVNEANLMPLSYKLYDKIIDLNLKNNDYEYDVKNFFQYYSHIFYKTNFNYSKQNIPIIDFSNPINNSNKDFQFGCKRISYLKSKSNQFAFFAPIYVEKLEDIKGKIFRIKITFSKTNLMTRNIDIHISSSSESLFKDNRLINYLERYVSKIDDKVIYCSPSYKNIYYGINLLEGGFIKVEDNISSNIYKKYYTINDFDCILNDGFKRNNLMMKQIIPLSFIFNANNLLDDHEKIEFKNCQIKISGNWIDSTTNEKIQFYDFSDNYTIFKEKVTKLYNNDYYNFVSSDNIMSIGYPGFNESSSENYKYVNTISKNYNRWKMKYSDDFIPYIVNLNYAFSINQESLYAYKEFPQFYSPIAALCTNSKYGGKYDIDFEENKENINSIINDKYVCGFFNTLTKMDKSSKYIDIFSPKYEEFWKDVDLNDNKVYYKGILYDFNDSYKKDDTLSQIDKFSVFVIPQFSYTLSTEYDQKYVETKYLYENNIEKDIVNLITENDPQDTTKLDYFYISNHLGQIKNNIALVKDPNGEYYLNENLQQYTTNRYYDVNDIYLLMYILSYSNQNTNNDSVITLLNNNYIEGYKLLNVCYNKNIISNIYNKINEIYEHHDKFNDGAIFREKRFLNSESIWGLHDNLYFSIYPSQTKYKLLDNYNLIENSDDLVKINVFMKSKFIDRILINGYEEYLKYLTPYYFSNCLYNKEDNMNYCNEVFVPLKLTEDHYGYLDNLDNTRFFEEEDTINNVIYVDKYNLNNLFIVNNLKLPGNQSVSSYFFNKQTYERYALFLNKEHIEKYLDKYPHASDENLIDNIYVRVRCFNHVLTENSTFDTVSINDVLLPISTFFTRQSSTVDYLTIAKYVDYNVEYGYFYFNDLYWKEENYKVLNSHEVMHFDIVFKLEMYKMDDVLYNLITELLQNNKNEYIFKDLFLYHPVRNEDFKHELYYNKYDFTDPIYANLIFPNYESIGVEIESYISILNNFSDGLFVAPYFNNIYEEEKIDTRIYNDIFLNKVYRTKEGYYRYDCPNLDLVYKIQTTKYSNGVDSLDLEIVDFSSMPEGSPLYNVLHNYSNFRLFLKNLIIFYNYSLDRDPIKNHFSEDWLNFDTYYGMVMNDDDQIRYCRMMNPKHNIILQVQSNEGSTQSAQFSIYVVKYSEDINDLYNISIYDNDKNLKGSFGEIEFDKSNNFVDIEEHPRSVFFIVKSENIYYLLCFMYNDDEWNKFRDNNIHSIYYIYYEMDIHNQYWQISYANSNDIFRLSTLDYLEGLELIEQENANISDVYRYSLASKYTNVNKDNIFITKSQLMNMGLVGNLNNVKIHDNNLITYTFNNHNYGFYIMNYPFDNTKFTLNLTNDYANNIKCVDYINRIDVSQINEYCYTYLGSIFKQIIPYINNNNIVKNFLNNINTIVKPNEYVLTNNYKQYPNVRNDEVYSYTIYYDKKKYDIKLMRYFDNIVPYIPKAKYGSSYFLYYKNNNYFIEQKLHENNISYVMYEEQHSINIHNKVKYFYIPNNSTAFNITEYEPTEYKYFNDNKYFNLESEFEIHITKDSFITYKEMMDIENDNDYIYNLFKQYIYNSITNYDVLDIELNNDRILFLYNRYDKKFYHLKKINNLYDLKIKFYLT